MKMPFGSLWDRVRSSAQRLFGNHETLQEDRSVSGEDGEHANDSSQNPRSLSTDYTELMGGSVPCPSCKGTGRIPKEMEETLVALIPLNDDRLKPKRTWFWVLMGIVMCTLLASGAIFMLVPRAVDLHSNRPAINIIHVTEHKPQPPTIRFHFMNYVNISNSNYYVVQVVNTSATIISKFQPWSSDVIGSGLNASTVSVAPLSNNNNQLMFNNSVTLTDVVAEYCQAPFSRLTSLYVNMQFDIAVALVYFNHREQVSLSTTQQMGSATEAIGEEREQELQEEKSKNTENVAEKQIEEEEEAIEEDMISIDSSDLAMADETCDDSEEEDSANSAGEDVTDDITVEVFDPNLFAPTPLKSIMPPWKKHSSAKCDSKNWEIFVEALEAFDQDTILEGRDDFIVTIETLIPHLGECFSMIKEDESITEKDVSAKLIIWIEVCLGKDAQTYDEVHKLNDIAFEVLKSSATAPKEVGLGLIESGVVELLIEIIEDPGCADIRSSSLHSLFRLLLSPTIWREVNERFREVDVDDSHGTLYSRLVATTLEERYFPSKNVIPFVILIVSWSRFLSSLIQLEFVAKDVFPAISAASGFDEVPIDELMKAWQEFQLSLEIVRNYVKEFNDEKVCASFDIYIVLESSDFPSICLKLLSVSRVADKWPNVLQFIRYLLNDRYYGTLFIASQPELQTFYGELKRLADGQKADEILSGNALFDEGVWEFDEKFPDAKEVYFTVTYRLYVLHLLDEIRACAGSLHHNVDDDQKINAMISLCELCSNDRRGRKEVVWALSQKYVYYVLDVLDYAISSRSTRSSACFALCVQLLAVVVNEVDNPRFWIKHAKMLSRLVVREAITTSYSRSLYEHLVPFVEEITSDLSDPHMIELLFRNITDAMEHKVQVTPELTTNMRLLEATFVHAKGITCMELCIALERRNTMEKMAVFLFELAQYRHVMWQMGEPLSSEGFRVFFAFALPALRIYATYFRSCAKLIGQAVPKRNSLRAKEEPERFVQMRPLGESLLDALLLMWSCTGGINGQTYSDECRTVRLAVLDVLTPSLYSEKSLAPILRHIIYRSCSRPHLFPALLSLLLALAPCAPPLVFPKTEMHTYKDVVIGHRQRVKRFVDAFTSCDNRAEIAELLLSPNAYVSELSRAFIERMAGLDYRITSDIVSILLNYISSSIDFKVSVMAADQKAIASSQGNDGTSSKTEVHKSFHASTGMVRMVESFQALSDIQNYRIVLYDFLSRSPDRLRLLSPILLQFEKPTLESERQLRYQAAVLEIVSGLCNPAFWTMEPPNIESFAKDSVGFAMFSELKEEKTYGIFEERKEETEKADDADSDVVIVEDDSNKVEKAIEKSEVEKDSDNKIDTRSTLEMVILSLLRFVNNSEQKMSLVQEVLLKLMDMTAGTGVGSGVFLSVLRPCMINVGLLPLFKRLSASLECNETLTCLSSVANILDKVAGDRREVLNNILEFSPSDHPLITIVSHITKMERLDKKTEFLLQTLDRFFQMLNDGSVLQKVSKANELSLVPQVNSRTMDEVYKIYSKPLLQVVDGVQKIREKMRMASRVIIHRKITTGTRMGSEVSKLIEANKGKERAVRKIVRTQMNLPDDDASSSPYKKRRSSSRT